MSTENYIPDPTATAECPDPFTMRCSVCDEWSNPTECDEHNRCPNCQPVALLMDKSNILSGVGEAAVEHPSIDARSATCDRPRPEHCARPDGEGCENIGQRATPSGSSAPPAQNFHPCPTCRKETEGSRGRVTGIRYPICDACMKREEDGVDAAIQAVCFLVKQVAPQFAAYAKTPLPSTSFSEWLESRGDALPDPQSFTEWLDRTGDSINEAKRRK